MKILYAAVVFFVHTIQSVTASSAPHNFTGTYCMDRETIQYTDSTGRRRTRTCLGRCRATVAECSCINWGYECVNDNSCCGRLKCTLEISRHSLDQKRCKLRNNEQTPALPSHVNYLAHGTSGEDCKSDIRLKNSHNRCLGVCKVKATKCDCVNEEFECKTGHSCCGNMQCLGSICGHSSSINPLKAGSFCHNDHSCGFGFQCNNGRCRLILRDQ